jgi:hypothetical protein
MATKYPKYQIRYWHTAWTNADSKQAAIRAVKTEGRARRGVVMNNKYTVLAAWDQDDLDRSGAVIEDGYDTLKEAKHRAKYYLTDEYQRGGEMSRPLGYSQVRNQAGECVADFFRS